MYSMLIIGKEESRSKRVNKLPKMSQLVRGSTWTRTRISWLSHLPCGHLKVTQNLMGSRAFVGNESTASPVTPSGANVLCWIGGFEALAFLLLSTNLTPCLPQKGEKFWLSTTQSNSPISTFLKIFTVSRVISRLRGKKNPWPNNLRNRISLGKENCKLTHRGY